MLVPRAREGDHDHQDPRSGTNPVTIVRKNHPVAIETVNRKSGKVYFYIFKTKNIEFEYDKLLM